jgi:hypothetical protein
MRTATVRLLSLLKLATERSSDVVAGTPGTTPPHHFVHHGEPELPPMMSLLVIRLNGVAQIHLRFAASQLWVERRALRPWWQPPMSVKGATGAVLSPAHHKAVGTDAK